MPARDLLADESDRALIQRYLALPVLSDRQNSSLVMAAGRRYMRRKLSYEEAERLAAAGKIDAAALDGLRKEVEAARHVCDVAEGMGQKQADGVGGAGVLGDGSAAGQYAVDERAGGEVRRFTASFTEADLEALDAEFQTVYGRALPVSSRGESPMHRAMGFDHRGRFDVALNPSAPEGVWVRRYLIGKGVPFLAFRGAVRGQATGAHIHIGKPSTRVPKV